MFVRDNDLDVNSTRLVDLDDEEEKNEFRPLTFAQMIELRRQCLSNQ